MLSGLVLLWSRHRRPAERNVISSEAAAESAAQSGSHFELIFACLSKMCDGCIHEVAEHIVSNARFNFFRSRR